MRSPTCACTTPCSKWSGKWCITLLCFGVLGQCFIFIPLNHTSALLSENTPLEVVNHFLDIMSVCLEESEEINQDLLEKILSHLLPENKVRSASRLMESVCFHCSQALDSSSVHALGVAAARLPDGAVPDQGQCTTFGNTDQRLHE